MKLKELQNIELNIAKEVKRICKKHKLTFYLSEGTMLGAVRHQGFIPWDDDMDLMMPRDDYEKFLSIAPNELSKDYILQSSNTLPTYWTGSSKVRYLKDCDFSQPEYLHLTKNVGPYIDIFPLDYVPNRESIRQKIQYKKIRIFKLMLWYKSKLSNPKNRKKKVLKRLSYFFSVKTLQKKLKKEMIKFNKKKRNYIINFGSAYNPKKEIAPIEKYSEVIYVPFEDDEFPIPKGYDYILTKIYGNYMKLPPKSKQKPKHKFN